MNRYCSALDLIDDHNKINEYIKYHKNIWPEIKYHLLNVGIENMQIWHVGSRLFMIMDVNCNYDPKVAEELAKKNTDVGKWEKLMWGFQVAIPEAKRGEKWVAMDMVFELTK